VHRLLFFPVILAALFLLHSSLAFAQPSLRQDAVASAGGGESANGEVRLSDTVGLCAIGVSTTPTIRETAGFWFGPFADPTAIHEDPSSVLPVATRLHQNHPNPFRPTTRIAIDIAGQSGRAVPTHLGIFDVGGRLVRTLVKGELTPGSYEFIWEGRDARFHPVASGVYFGRLSAGETTQVKRLVLMK
jgi:hypothetical protein